MFHLHTYCRACGYGAEGAPCIKSASADKLIEVFDLGVQPLANSFASSEYEHPCFAPLKVLFCPRCTLAQLSVVVRPDILYSNYAYITSASDTMKAHFARLWEDMQRERPIKSVVEIGSNTGDFLQFCRENGAERVLGIDPAKNLYKIAEAKEIPTINDEFDWVTAMEVRDRMMDLGAVVARHVFCHIDDWHDFVSNLKQLGDAETIYCIEVPYAVDMIAMHSWDQIYHEHLSYLNLKAMAALLEFSGLHMHSVRRYPIHGGAIVITLRRDESKMTPDASVVEMLAQESITADTWKDFAGHARVQQDRLKNKIEVALSQRKRVAGLGASAKSTVWINACGLTRKHIAFIADNTPQKQYTFSPGTDIPIVDEGAILRELPDYVVLFAWNFQAEVLEKFALARSKGVRFIVPVPEVVVV
jgi:SAM-dependent methyltransferase